MEKDNLLDNNSNSISVDPRLIFLLGDTDLAVILQQIHYRLILNKKSLEMDMIKDDVYKDGRIWCRSSYEQLERQFLWMSVITIKRKIAKLVEMGLLIKGNYNKWKADRTLWYTIDYKKLSELTKDLESRLLARRKQIEQRKERQKEYNKQQNSTKKDHS